MMPSTSMIETLKTIKLAVAEMSVSLGATDEMLSKAGEVLARIDLVTVMTAPRRRIVTLLHNRVADLVEAEHVAEDVVSASNPNWGSF
jgi:hypothetical protein